MSMFEAPRKPTRRAHHVSIVVVNAVAGLTRRAIFFATVAVLVAGFTLPWRRYARGVRLLDGTPTHHAILRRDNALKPRHVRVRSAFVTVPRDTSNVSVELGTAERVGNASVSKVPVRHSLIWLAGLMFIVGAALAAAETAITTLWPWKVRELAEKEGESSPFSVLESDLTRFLTTILVTTTSATVFSTAIATEVAGDILGAAAVGYVTAGLTVFFLFFGEILPKALAVHAPAKVARVMVPVIRLLSVIVYPVGKLLAWVSTQILRLLKLPMENDGAVSEEELRLIVAGADQSGSIEKYESQIIQNVLDLEDTDVRAVMCPRVDMVALPATHSLEALLEMETDSHYSRMPVYEENIDNIVGVAMVKSLLRYLSEDASVLRETQVSEIMDPPFFVPESMSVWIVLEEMRKRRLHMAVVVDEYGGTAGLVTLEDILEEVVGEIYDEDDDVEAEAQVIEVDADGRYAMEGQTDLEKVDETLSLKLTEDELNDYGTISGFLCARMGGIPDVGDEIVFNKVRFTVAEADDRRILSLRAEVLTEAEMLQITDGEAGSDETASEMSCRDAGSAGKGSGGRENSTAGGNKGVHNPSSGNGHSDEFAVGKLISGIFEGTSSTTGDNGSHNRDTSKDKSGYLQSTDQEHQGGSS
eukprot:GFKZ01002413.1.p1 GENE.GFKZ01002413.1~~GFKZ01002413.1.p1  ORF type:complete len:752 (+),score=96.71 GFKZ01002413.1:325-2256(+)